MKHWIRVQLAPDPLGYPRHGLVVFLLALTVLSGLVTVAGEPAAGSMEASLPHQVVLVWGSMLLLGGSTALVGMYWQGDIRTGLVTKRFGYAALTVAAVPYSVVILGTYGLGGMFSSGIILGFAFACGHTAWRVEQRIQAVLAEQVRAKVQHPSAQDDDEGPQS